MKSDARKKTPSPLERLVWKILGLFQKKPVIVVSRTIPKCYQGWASGELSLGPKTGDKKLSI